MPNRLKVVVIAVLLASASLSQHSAAAGKSTKSPHKFEIAKTDAEWRRLLSPEVYAVTRKKSTELACSGPYLHNHEVGVYVCADCGKELFRSTAKFESGTGWPSFWAPLSKESVLEELDNSLGMRRTEILCSRCGAHLGHVFNDGPKPTGRRYCINSLALRFVKAPPKNPSK